MVPFERLEVVFVLLLRGSETKQILLVPFGFFHWQDSIVERVGWIGRALGING